MKKAHFSDSQILAILKQAESGVPIEEEKEILKKLR